MRVVNANTTRMMGSRKLVFSAVHSTDDVALHDSLIAFSTVHLSSCFFVFSSSNETGSLLLLLALLTRVTGPKPL